MGGYSGVRDLAMRPVSPPASMASPARRPRDWFRSPIYARGPSFDQRPSLDRMRPVSITTEI